MTRCQKQKTQEPGRVYKYDEPRREQRCRRISFVDDPGLITSWFRPAGGRLQRTFVEALYS